MKQLTFFGFLIALFFFCTVVCLALKRVNQCVTEKKRLRVVCTISMITDVVKYIAGEHVEVIGLMGPGVDPHLYKARESDVYTLYNADLIFFNGLHLEGKMGDLLKTMAKKTVALAEKVEKNKLIKAEFAEIYDPHVWHDVSFWIEIAQKIKKCLIELDGHNADKYESAAKQYIALLADLNIYVKKTAEELPASKRILVTAHDAFNYFGRAYGFEVVGLQGISTDCEISMKDIQQLADFIVQKKISAIFVESSIPQRNIQAVQRAVESRNHQVTIGAELFSDALGPVGTSACTYIGMIKHNIDSIVMSLR